MEGEAAGDRRLEYDSALKLLSELNETRFRLLALVPTLAGTVVALVSPRSTAVELVAIGVLGLSATLGVVLYDVRNGQVRRRVVARVQELERVLLPGGPLAVANDLGTSLVYGAALGGWCYLVAWGALRAAHAGHPRAIGLAVGAALGVIAAVALPRVRE